MPGEPSGLGGATVLVLVGDLGRWEVRIPPSWAGSGCPWAARTKVWAQCVETAVSSRALFVKAKMRLNPSQEVWIQAQSAKGAQGEKPRASGYQLLRLCILSHRPHSHSLLPALSSQMRFRNVLSAHLPVRKGPGVQARAVASGFPMGCPPPEPDTVQAEHSAVC